MSVSLPDLVAVSELGLSDALLCAATHTALHLTRQTDGTSDYSEFNQVLAEEIALQAALRYFRQQGKHAELIAAQGGAARHLRLKWKDQRRVICLVNALICAGPELPELLAQGHVFPLPGQADIQLQTAFLPLRHGIPSFVASPLVSGQMIGWTNNLTALMPLRDLWTLEKLLGQLADARQHSSGAA